MTRASGTFAIEVWEPEPTADAGADGLAVGAVRIVKRFAGDLVATGSVRMASATIGGEPVVYVALERIEGVLLGRPGGFLLRHLGVMQDGVGTLDCTVVPGSGTGALSGLAGSFTIDVVDGVHRWSFEHSLD